MTEVIGITGGIGSGKSRVCSYLAKLCQLPVIDLDQICKQLLLMGEPGWLALKEALGKKFFSPTGELDRMVLRNVLFTDDELRHQVDALLHPLARLEMKRQAGAEDDRLVLAEIPLLFEAGWQKDVSQIVVVYADSPACLQRIVERDHVSEHQARQAIEAQQCLREKALQANHVINNSRDWQETCVQIRHLADCLGCR